VIVTAAGDVTCIGGAGTSATASGAFASGTTYLVVAKLQSGATTAWVKLYAPGDVIPTTDTGVSWTATVANTSSVSQDRFQIAVTAGTVEIDEFLYGTTWADVVGNMTKANNTTALNVAGSWSGGVVPGTSDVPVWNSTVAAANTTNSLGADTTWGGMVVRDPGGLVTLNAGNNLTLGAAAKAIDMSAATANLTLSCPLIMGAANVWDVAANRTLTLGGVVSGASTNSITKQGAGTAALTAANTYTGETLFNAGIINVASLATYAAEATSGSPLGGRSLAQDQASSGASIGLHFAGGTLQYTGSGAQTTDRYIRVKGGIANSCTLDASGATSADILSFSQSGAPLDFWDGTGTRSVTLTGNNTGANTFALNIPDDGATATSLIKSGNGTWDVTHTHNSDATTSTVGTYGGYTGGTTLSGGTLGFASGALGASGTIDFTGNATLQWDSGNTQDLSSRIKIEDGITATIDTGANTVAFASALTVGSAKTAALTKAGSGTLTLSAAQTYTGLTTISAGTLALGNGIALAANSGVSIAAGACFDISASTTYTWGSGASLIASGTGTAAGSTAAEIKAGAGSTGIDLGSRPVTLNFTPTSFSGDSTHPALYVSSGVLNINGVITVVNNGATPLGNGTYLLIKAANASSTGTPTFNGIVGGQGIAVGKNALVQRNAITGDIELMVQDALTPTIALTRHSGTVDSSTYGDALLFDVSVTGAGATPTGTVELRDGSTSGTLLNNGTLSGGNVSIAPTALNALTAGTHTLYAMYSGDSTYEIGNSTLSQTVLPLSVTVSGASVSSKMFDNTTTASVTGGTVLTPVTGDTITEINVSSVGSFANAGPGTGIAVNVALGGTKASSYSLSQPGLTADILTTATWTDTATPATWDTAANWQNSVVGTGSGNTADFNSVNITADTTVNLNSARTIGHLIFGDTDSSGASWTLANNGTAANKLILAGTTPTVTVNNLGAAGKATISAVVDGTVGLTKSGEGTLALTGANTYSGGTVVNNSTLSINTDGALGAVPGSATPANITLNGGTLQTAAASLSISANRGISIGSGGGTIANSGGGTLTYVGIIAGPGGLTLNSPVGSSAITLNAQSTYSGGTIINGPSSVNILCLTGSFGSAGNPTSGPFGKGPITWNGPSTRSTTGSPVTIANAIIFAADTTFLNGSGEQTLFFSGPVTLLNSNRTLTVNIGQNDSTKSLTLSGAIGDGGNTYGLTKAGTGNLVLSGANTYGGDTIITAGKLELGATGVIPDGSGKGNVLLTGTLDLNSFSETINGLSGTGTVDTVAGGTPTLTVGGNDATSSFSGVIKNTAGSLALTKIGAGTLTLSGSNTYIGATTVNQGTLSLAGASQTSPITVSSGASLEFTLNSPTTSTSTFNLSAGTIKISGTPTLASYTLITSSAGITGTPILNTPIPGYSLQVSGNTLKLVGGFTGWIAGNFANGTVPSGQQGPNDDPDHDGISNLVEYALAGLDPTVGNAAVGTINGTTFSFTKRENTTGLTYAIEESSDLGATSWAEVPAGPSYINNATTISYTLDPNAAVKNFIRLKVSTN